MRQHVGLGAATRVDRLVITWPGSGTVQEFVDLEAGRILEIVEGDPVPRPLSGDGRSGGR
jgi:hypothetical protein